MASANKHKIKEVGEILSGFGFDFVSMRDLGINDEIEEIGSTFSENSFIKASFIAKKYGYNALADDSGLMVDYLGGAPGVYSARFAGSPCSDQNNNDLLLKKLEGVPEEKRGAKFVSAITLILTGNSSSKNPDSWEVLTAEGYLEGRILEIPRGDSGFGYDPLFYLPEKQKAMAELIPSEKNAISHRFRALEKLAALLIK